MKDVNALGAESESPQPNINDSVPARLYPPNYDSFHRAEYRPKDVSSRLALTSADFERFRAFILEKIGLDYPTDKQQILAQGLAEVMEAVNCASLDRLYDLLLSCSTTSALWDRLISALTIGETYFLRNTKHFDALAKTILPELIAEREHSSRRIRIWSAGCSTGEEPYSIAILLKELIPHPESWNILILATDINREALRKAQEGVYSAWSFRGVEKRVQDTYFRLIHDKQFAITDDIKRMVTFGYLNLVTDPYPSLTENTNAMDIILCRNVMIYFTAQVTQQVLKNFYNCLLDGGWLIPGASEPNMIYYNMFEPRNFPGAVIYQKPRSPRPPAQHPFFVSNPTPEVSPVYSPAKEPPPIEAPNSPLLKPNAPIPPSAINQSVPSSQFAQNGNGSDVYQRALELMHNGQVEVALVKLYEKIDKEPNFAPAYYTIGKIYANKGNLEEAQAWCERALARDRLHAEPYYTLSMIYQQHGLLDRAVDALKKAIYLDRNFVLAHYNLAQIYFHQGEHALAVKSLENVKQLLQGKPREEVIPEGDGLVAGRLLEIVESELGADSKG